MDKKNKNESCCEAEIVHPSMFASSGPPLVYESINVLSVRVSEASTIHWTQ